MNMTRHSGHTVSIVVIFAVLLILTPPLMAAPVNIDLNSTNQTIRGFGGMNFPRWIGTLTNTQADTAFGNGPGQIGFTIMRCDVPPDSGDWSGEISAAVRAKSHGAIIFASPWSPPASMKTNGSTVHGSLEPSSYGEFADYLTDFANYMSSNGASLYAISLQNEADFLPESEYESCLWTPTEMRTFLDHNAPVIPTKVMAPETVHPKSAWYDALYSAPELDIYADHLYGGSPTTFAKEHWMTEHLVLDTNYPAVLETGKEIHDCMANDYSAYVWWYIRRFYGPMDEDGTVTKRGYVMSQFAKFVRPGYIRVDATENPSSGVYVTAYAGSGNLVIVAINQNSYSSDVTFSVSGGSVSSYTKYKTSISNNVSNEGSVGSTDTLDANSINTFIGTISGGDTTAPIPDPMEWAVDGEPNATGSSSITMTVTTATDDTPPVEYYFECTNYGDANSGWQTSPTYIAQGLNPSTQYTFRVKARDSSFNQNETGFSGTASATTHDSQGIEILGSWVTGTTHAEETGSDRALIFIAHGESTESMNLSTVTYGGQSMEKVVDYSYNAASGWAYAAAFILDEAGISAASTSTFNPSWGGTAPGSSGYASVFLANVDQTEPNGATDKDGSTSNPVTTSALSTEEGDMVILAATCGQAGSYTLNNGFIEGTDQQMGSTVTGATGHKSATGADETPSATYSSSINRQMIIGFVVQAPPFSDYQTCAEVQAGGHGLISDLTGDCYVNYADFETITYYWLDDDCSSSGDCEGADFEPDDDVDFADFSTLGLQWAQCNDPKDSGCFKNW